jgi:hypothetical protein
MFGILLIYSKISKIIGIISFKIINKFISINTLNSFVVPPHLPLFGPKIGEGLGIGRLSPYLTTHLSLVGPKIRGRLRMGE